MPSPVSAMAMAIRRRAAPVPTMPVGLSIAPWPSAVTATPMVNRPPVSIRPEVSDATIGTFRGIVRTVASERGVRIAKWLGEGCMIVAVEQ